MQSYLQNVNKNENSEWDYFVTTAIEEFQMKFPINLRLTVTTIYMAFQKSSQTVCVYSKADNVKEIIQKYQKTNKKN